MPRRFDPAVQDQLVVATHNPGKLQEIGALLAPFSVRVSSAADHGLRSPAETGTKFVENALLKARHAVAGTGLPALSDDSGLSVSVLDGAPGVYSADWAGPEKDFQGAMKRIVDLVDSKGKDRTAQFRCTLVLAWPDGHHDVFEGVVPGTIVWPPRGDLGFGYDPFFVPDGHDQTFGEMTPQAKQAVSHRARAFAALVEGCFEAP